MALHPPHSPQPESFTPPDSPRLAVLPQPLAVYLLVQALTRVLQQTQTKSAGKTETIQPKATETPKSEEPTEKNLPGRASKLEYKTVNEIWDQSNGYKIEEATNTKKDVEEMDQYVFVLRKKFDKSNMDFTSYLDIKSEALRDVLREVLKDVPGISLCDDMPTIDASVLFHYVADLMSLNKNREGLSDTVSKHVGLLVQFMNDRFGAIARKLRSMLKQQEITFDLLWGLYKPNELIYTTCPGTGQPRCARFVSAEEKVDIHKGKYLGVKCRYLNYDGKRFGEATVELEVEEFSRVRKVGTLNAFPLHFHKHEETVRKQLVECGRKFVSLQGTHHKRYQGEAFYVRKGAPHKVHVNSRVIVDATSFKDANPNYSFSKLQESSHSSYGNVIRLWGDVSSGPNSILDKPIPTEDVQVEFAVAGLEDIEWNATSFDRLALEPGKKRTIEALVQSAESGKDAVFDDFVSGKGKGIICLLHGPPGVGKTLTAEGISEHLRRPLYSACAGELSNDPSVLKNSLGQILHLASHWKAVLLLDEADVFLEQRSLGMHIANSLISVFLRMLEYFEGIMFLTTNRLTVFDEAILSRIHLALRFNNLDKSARESVWHHFLAMAEESHEVASITQRELTVLIDKKLNGRQIRNVVRAGLALAKAESTPLAFSQLEGVLDAMEEFQVDFQGHAAVESLRSYQ